jgi:hypothetical protein
MKKDLTLELLESGLNLDSFFNISINHSTVRMIGDFNTELLEQITALGFKRAYILYDDTRVDMIEYKKANLQIVLSV